MAVNGITGYSNILRLSGLASGLDTDSIVKQMMDAERIPLDKLYQKRQLAEWKTEAYRSITSLLQGFKNTYFNYANPATNMLSQTNYKTYTSTVVDSVTGAASTALTATGSTTAMAGEHTVDVLQLATAAKRVSAAGVTKALAGSEAADFGAVAGRSFIVTLDGAYKTITFAADGSDSSIEGLNGLLEKAFGAGKVTVSETSPGSGVLQFATGDGATRVTLNAAETGDALASLKFTSGASNRLSTGMTLEEVAASLGTAMTFVDGNVTFKLNGTDFSFSQYETLGSVINQINSDSTAKVTISYDELTDKFALVSDVTGATTTLNIDESASNFFTALGLTAATETAGQDSRIMFDDTLVTRSSNKVTVNGITLNLNKVTEDPVQIKLALDTDKIYDNIKSFVDEYNKVITTINEKLHAEYDRSYQPLTDAQKEEMTEEQIKKWEETAKTGLLRNDSLLQNIVYGLRRAVVDPIAGVSGSLLAIGITTGSYTQNGLLTIDETKLKEAIASDPDKVMQLFAKQSDIDYYDADTAAERMARYNSEGIIQRFYDVLEDNIKTYGGKGLLLEKAGITGDATEFDNLLQDDIDKLDKQIERLVDRLAEKETAYYNRFTALEMYIQRMNSQSAWLTQQFGSES